MRCITYLLPLLLASMLGCGPSGGAGDANETRAADAASSVGVRQSSSLASAESSSSWSAASEVTSSSSLPAGVPLAERAALSQDDLNVYVTRDVFVPMTDFKFDGALRFVKIQSALMQTLFLGQWSANADFALPLHVELAAFPLVVEVFSELPSDNTVYWEVAYDDQ